MYATSKSDQAIQRLDAAIAAITTGEQFTALLRFKARMHAYSMNNVMLIMMANPDATHVAGFKTWLALKRNVRKGEKGIPILVPHRVAYQDKETGEKAVAIRGFGIGHVFDVSQTDGEPVPAPVRPVHIEADAERAAAIESRVRTWFDANGIAFATETIAGTVNGYWSPDERKVALSSALAPPMRAKTICHELAHCLCEHTGEDDRRTGEVIAESAAFVALAAVGVDSESYTAPYVAHWAQDVAAFRAALKEIESASRRIIAIIADPEVSA